MGAQDEDDRAELDESPPEIAEPLALGVGIYADVDHAQYHLDPSAVPSLSSSIANVIATRSPRHGWRDHVRLGAKGKRRATAAMDGGSLVHMLALGSGPKVRIVEAPDWKKKAVQDERKAARAAGELPILAGVYKSAVETVKNTHIELARRGIDLEPMAREVTAIWEEGGATCRARADAWDAATATLYDLKFLSDGEPKAFARHMMNFGSDVQAAAYVSGFGKLHPEFEGRIRFKFIVIEQETGEILITPPGGSMRALGEFKWAYALRRWSECMASGVWPGYAEDKEIETDAPEYATRDLLKGGSDSLPF